MPPTDYHSLSSFPFSNFSRSIMSTHKLDKVHSMEATQELGLQPFQEQVADHFSDLSAVGSDDLLSLSWIRKLLIVFLRCQNQFRAILLNNRAHINKAPLDKLMNDYFERSVKALDVCNAIRDGIERIRQWEKQLEIVLCALENQRSSLGEGQFRRAKKGLNELAIQMLDENKSTPSIARRNLSFGRNNVKKDHKSFSQSRSLSWSVPRKWSAARQIQSIGNNLVPPKANEILATNGLAIAVFTMTNVLYFVMWALVSAIPCQDRVLNTQFSIPRQFTWAAPVLSIHERILEESKKRERRNTCGLLKEIREIEICAHHMNDLMDSVKFPLTDEKEREVKKRVEEVRRVFGTVKDELDPLEAQVKEVFRRIVRNRTEDLDSVRREKP